MSRRKMYGVDGPPQLHDLFVEIPQQTLNEWIAKGGDATWTFNDPEWWRNMLKCSCGETDAFHIQIANSDIRGWLSGESGGNQRCDVSCAKCSRGISLFDDGIHGYNAVICDVRSELPPNYRQTNASLLQTLNCDCGGNCFSVIVEAMYDCGDDLESIPRSQWDDAYGAFVAVARCSSCGKIRQIVEAETA